MTQDPDCARDDALVFLSKHGKPLSAQVLSYYWQPVRAAAHLGAKTDFYLATEHLGVNLPDAQLGRDSLGRDAVIPANEHGLQP